MSNYPWRRPCMRPITLPDCSCDPCKARWELERLSVEMAEAILNFMECPVPSLGYTDAFNELHYMAAKLRKIGTENE